VPHGYEGKDDQEIAAFVAALFAYGQADLAIVAAKQALAPFGGVLRRSIESYSGQSLWPGFRYRFHNEGHLIVLFTVLGRALRRWGSLEAMFFDTANDLTLPSNLDGSGTKRLPLEAAMHRGVLRFRQLCLEQGAHPSLHRGLRFFVNTPLEKGACKRLTMFFRWMVRKDRLDLGLWTGLTPKDLIMPMDTHVSRISYYLGLRSALGQHSTPEAQAPHWRMAKELTQVMALIDPEDPVRYDFAMARLGILDLCQKRFAKSVCGQCPLLTACRYTSHRVS
jgi:uncharacterized protein (TIGR02757 family)